MRRSCRSAARRSRRRTWRARRCRRAAVRTDGAPVPGLADDAAQQHAARSGPGHPRRKGLTTTARSPCRSISRCGCAVMLPGTSRAATRRNCSPVWRCNWGGPSRTHSRMRSATRPPIAVRRSGRARSSAGGVALHRGVALGRGVAQDLRHARGGVGAEADQPGRGDDLAAAPGAGRARAPRS